MYLDFIMFWQLGVFKTVFWFLLLASRFTFVCLTLSLFINLIFCFLLFLSFISLHMVLNPHIYLHSVYVLLKSSAIHFLWFSLSLIALPASTQLIRFRCFFFYSSIFLSNSTFDSSVTVGSPDRSCCILLKSDPWNFTHHHLPAMFLIRFWMYLVSTFLVHVFGFWMFDFFVKNIFLNKWLFVSFCTSLFLFCLCFPFTCFLVLHPCDKLCNITYLKMFLGLL